MTVFESIPAIKACFPGKSKYAFLAGFTLLDMAYGKRLAEAMALARVDREKLALALGVSVQAVGQVLTGKTRALTAENSAKAARFLKVDHYWLATGEGEPKARGLSEEARAFGEMYDSLDANERERWQLLVRVARNGVPDAQVEKKMPATAKKRPKEHS